ncbi:hypothetical protein DH2020_045506 [Rehmannia glutinosa]|uniref:RING-type E3 ubiquitin transferase n=1 Tax=Rehmannia glutinosa TaxID=99300 RepID=A0ABR0UEV4_REHGL
MGSVGNQNPWAPYDNYRDCSQGICSIYCPQFCYFFFPPPPPSDDDSTPFSPLIIAIIGVLASAFLLVSYYTVVTRYCKRRNNQNTSLETEENHHDDQIGHDQWRVAVTGLDESVIKTITVCKYRKEDGLIEGTECAVCLSEFQENESLRLLPKCSHAFHLPCIDTWLKSHSNCPLCRANVVAIAHPVQPQDSQASFALNVDTYESHRPNADLILVVDDPQRNCVEQVVGDRQRNFVEQVVGDIENTGNREIRNENVESDENGVKRFRRSISLGAFPFQRHLLISDVLEIEGSDEDLLQVGKDQYSWRGNIGSSKGFVRSHDVMKRSVSTGGLMFTVHGKGKNNSILPS